LHIISKNAENEPQGPSHRRSAGRDSAGGSGRLLRPTRGSAGRACDRARGGRMPRAPVQTPFGSPTGP
jgi:hypothetical protein